MTMAHAAPVDGRATAMAAPPLDASWLNGLERDARSLLQSGSPEVWDALTRKFEARLIHTALEVTRGRRIEAAQKLGIGRNTITRKIQELGLDDFHSCMVDAGAMGRRAGDAELEDLEDDATGRDDDASPADEHADPMRALQQHQRHVALNAAFDALEEAERYVMESIYREGKSLRDIGEVLGVSESRVSRMSTDIIAKLRRRLRDW